MLLQFWFTENIIPPLTQEQKDEYRTLVENQMIPIGNIVNDRRLIRCMTTQENFDVIIKILTDSNKEPHIIGALTQEGEEIVTRDFIEYNSFFVPTQKYDEMSWVIKETIPDPSTSYGWVDFDFVKEVI